MIIHTGFQRAVLGKGLTGAKYFSWNGLSYDFQRGGDRILDEGNNEFTIIVDDVDLKAIAQTNIIEVLYQNEAFVITSLEVITKTITGAAAMPTIQFGDGDVDSVLAPVQLNAGMNTVWARESWEPAALLKNVVVGEVTEDPFVFGVTVAGTSTTHTGIVIAKGIKF